MSRQSRARWLTLALGLAGAALIVAVAMVGAVGGPRAVAPSEAFAPPKFVDEAETAGVRHAYEGGFDFFVGGGVAAFDCSQNGLPDLFFAGGAQPAALLRNESRPGGELRFRRVEGLVSELVDVTGAYPVDIDGDGILDLAVLRKGENLLLRGLGECQFERANERWSLDGGDAWTTAFSATWEARSEWPTLAFGEYLDEGSEGSNRLCHDNVLVRPNAAGDGFAPPVSLSPGWCTLSLLFSDWDRSGRRDLRASNDRHYYTDYSPGQEQLWRIEPGLAPRLYTREDGWQQLRVWGMGIASHDLTGDGYPEYYLTSQGDNKLQTLTDGPTQPAYRDTAILRGATAHRPFTGDDQSLLSTAWHAEFADMNNDGLVDLFVSKGNVEAQAGHALQDPNNLLLGQPDGSFVESAPEAGIVHFGRTRGAALVDLDGDGMLDLVEVNRRENVRLWRNLGWGSTEQPAAMGNWLSVELSQPGGNLDAIGAWVQVKLADRLTEREVVVGGGHAGGQVGPVHFGLGRSATAELRVIWPDGEEGEWLQVSANQHVLVER
ncbi:CRTAC1 family protein [soil metagenome]